MILHFYTNLHYFRGVDRKEFIVHTTVYFQLMRRNYQRFNPKIKGDFNGISRDSKGFPRAAKMSAHMHGYEHL